ncbi:heavy metal-associated isoprenylated plant protein 6-like isoform X2 [Phragmites australis]|uniref:heavy metal-associated isoprenylated plant protein 6-like isoform X2 n=1 Tax=Phragmites australis TaxID=29695 RepID=UPI002D7996D1|nr:heavy metal-associated isoprenylated plant protein 6-like isoform X2 [Phragmites australis]
MTTESETPRITELHVRMDCNGCEHKIRKTLRAIEGVSEVYIDQANHKITVVGIADPERIVKAIRKTKRVPTICSHTDPAAEAQPPPAEGEAPPPADPPADAPPPAEAAPAEPAPENKEAPPAETPATDATVIHMVHDYPYDHGHHLYREHWANHPVDMHGVRYDAAPYHVTHSYSHHRPSPYVAEYGYGGSPVQEGRYYSHDYYPTRGKGDGSQITSMFSDENPNACSIA